MSANTERLRNSLRGFGYVTDLERDERTAKADEASVMVVGKVVSQWGVAKTPLYPDKEGKL